MSELFEKLINNKITLNEFKIWFDLQTNEQNLWENTSKYEFITYLLTNIHLSTNWLTQTLNDSTKPQNNYNLSTNETKISLNNNEIKENVFKSDSNIDNSIERKNKNLKPKQKLITVKELSESVQTIDLNDENLFPVLSSQTNGQICKESVDNSVKSRRTKRIKPTTIRVDDRISVGFFSSGRKSTVRKELIKTNNNLVSNQNTFESKPNFDSTSDNRPNDSLSAEREWLKKAKANEKLPKVFDKSKTQNISSATNEPTIKLEINRLVAIEANHNSVTFGQQLDLISNIYTLVLKSNFMPNFFDELKFICNLVAKRVFKEQNEEIRHNFDQYFHSYHNCVYFSVKCLEQLLITNGLICCLNKSVLKIITESTVLTQFESNFHQKLQSLYELQQKSVNKSSETPFITTLESVLFQSETDNKNHFPNDNSFHAFRRQRDEFYMIFNTYRNKNTTELNLKNSANVINLSFGNSVKHLLSLSTDSANFWHLSRLFVSQLLQTCVYKLLKCSSNLPNSDLETTSDDQKTVDHLSTDKERLKKLQKRFHQTKSQSNVCETNVFLKDEQFFRDFIFYGDSHAFNENLKLVLSDKILALNRDFDVFESDFDTDLCDERQQFRNKFRNNLITLKILSKFLGFINFYPFDTQLSNTNSVHEFIDSQTRLRCLQTKPAIDFEECLRMAVNEHKLLLTIPWISEFLSFIDPISSQMVYYENLYNLLVVIHRNLVLKLIQSVPNNGFFLLFSLTKTMSNKNLNYSNRFCKFVFNTLFVENSAKLICSSKQSLDLINDLIDSEFFNEFYPQLNSDLIQLFKQNVISNEVKKITPLTLPLIDSSNNSNKTKVDYEKQLRLQIEEQFFNSHSPSLKKTVDFLSDRITSKCIRRIRTEIFVNCKQQYIDSNGINNNSNNFNEINFYDITNAIQSQCSSFANDYCVKQINTIFPLLLNEDIDESVSEFAAKITTKLTIDKCFDWIQKNIIQSLIETDLKTAFKKNESNQLKDAELKVGNGSVVIDISPTFTAIRDLMSDLYAIETIEIESSIIVNLINDLSHLRRSHTLPKKTLDFIDVNIIDFSIALIAKQPKLLNETVMKLFVDYWLEFEITVEKYICPRNLFILSEQSKCALLSWNKYESMLLKMLSKGIINDKIIETDLLWTLKQEWSDRVLNRLASCLKSVVEYQKSIGKSDNNNQLTENQTIEWLSWFCSQSMNQ